MDNLQDEKTTTIIVNLEQLTVITQALMMMAKSIHYACDSANQKEQVELMKEEMGLTKNEAIEEYNAMIEQAKGDIYTLNSLMEEINHAQMELDPEEEVIPKTKLVDLDGNPLA